MKDILNIPYWYESKEIFGHYKHKVSKKEYFAISYNDILGWYEYSISEGKKEKDLTIFGNPIKKENETFYIKNTKIYQERVLVGSFEPVFGEYIFSSYDKEMFLKRFEKKE